MAPHLLCESRLSVCPLEEEFKYAGLFDIFVEGFARSTQGTIEVFRGPGLRRSSKALIPVTGVVALIVPANFMECIYSVGGSTYQLSEASVLGSSAVVLARLRTRLSLAA